MKLISYRYITTRFFGDSHEFIYELTMLKSYLFGLFTKECKVNYTISMFATIKNYTEHWDELIKSGERIKK